KRCEEETKSQECFIVRHSVHKHNYGNVVSNSNILKREEPRMPVFYAITEYTKLRHYTLLGHNFCFIIEGNFSCLTFYKNENRPGQCQVYGRGCGCGH